MPTTRNRSLTELQLWGNHISAEGGVAIAKALERNRSLATLVLMHNNLNESSASILRDAVRGRQGTNLML